MTIGHFCNLTVKCNVVTYRDVEVLTEKKNDNRAFL